ncbi:MAG: cell division protein FtsL [Gallionella sp.]|nr:cell division protein FtsL [Gallionella sp.]MDD4959034.1 cell division protein FtsL [Gallionella sp.]
MLHNRSVINGMLLAAVLMCALSVVLSQHEARKLLSQLQTEKNRAQQMDVEWGQLQLEQGTLSAPGRMANVLENKLEMRLPANENVRFIQLAPNGQAVLKP